MPKTTVIVVPIGGCGIISGIAIAAKSLLKNVRVIGVQAAGCAPVNKSLEEGKPVAVSEAQTIADGIAVKRPGDVTLPLIHEFVDEVVEVTFTVNRRARRIAAHTPDELPMAEYFRQVFWSSAIDLPEDLDQVIEEIKVVAIKTVDERESGPMTITETHNTCGLERNDQCGE